MPSFTAELISIGTELLTGRTVNTNAAWLAERITLLGGRVVRCTMIHDEIDAIASIVRGALRRGSEWVLVSGGLGPTYDDRTLEGVALALRRPLELNEEALGLVKAHYARIGRPKTRLTEARRKMALLPKGSRPLKNRVGTAPGVLLELRCGRTKLCCLPGVPSELKAIFEEEVAPLMRREGWEVLQARVSLLGIMESALAPSLKNLVKRYPDIYIKSHPQGREGGESRVDVELLLSSAEGRGRDRLKRALRDLVRAVKGKAKVMGMEGP